LSANDITTENTDFDITHPLYQKVCVFTGTLDKMLRKDAMQIVVDLGGICDDNITSRTNFLILGNNDYSPLVKDGKSNKQKKAEKLKLDGNDIEIISESVFYDIVNV
jgi:DNA polymerase-3 subunit epsilon